MTVLNELLPIMIDLSLHNKTGTINLTNPGLISHNEILNMYKEIYRLEINICGLEKNKNSDDYYNLLF